MNKAKQKILDEFDKKFPASEIVNDDDEPIRSLYSRVRAKRLLEKALDEYVEAMSPEEKSNMWNEDCVYDDEGDNEGGCTCKVFIRGWNACRQKMIEILTLNDMHKICPHLPDDPDIEECSFCGQLAPM